MGRRSIKTTKSGKYINSADQIRKQDRKKELKKNKRMRQIVKTTVLKNMDPSQILKELEIIDNMEYNVLQPSPFHENVLRDKRKKLIESFNRVLRLYQHDAPEHWSQLKCKEAHYEERRLKKQQFFESVKHAERVKINEIPLPPTPVLLALPSFALGALAESIKKSDDDVASKSPVGIDEDDKDGKLLGVPPGPPPNLFNMSDLDTDAEGDEVELKHYSPPQISGPSISGQNIDEFMKEMENVHKKYHADKEEPSNEADILDNIDNDDSQTEYCQRNSKETTSKEATKSNSLTSLVSAVVPPISTIPQPPTAPQNTTSFLPVNILALHMPKSPLPPMLPLGIHSNDMNMPPWTQPGLRLHSIGNFSQQIGLPPQFAHPLKPPDPNHPQQNALSKIQNPSEVITTITAKPKIRSLKTDVTSFVPSVLRNKRELVRKPLRHKHFSGGNGHHQHKTISTDAMKSTTKDDAYIQFMNEMKGLL